GNGTSDDESYAHGAASCRYATRPVLRTRPGHPIYAQPPPALRGFRKVLSRIHLDAGHGRHSPLSEPIMMMEAFRCIHASRLLLDHQLHGLQLPASAALVRNLREIVEEATLISFEQIVESCLVHEVNCLLLSGDSF